MTRRILSGAVRIVLMSVILIGGNPRRAWAMASGCIVAPRESEGRRLPPPAAAVIDSFCKTSRRFINHPLNIWLFVDSKFFCTIQGIGHRSNYFMLRLLLF